jgi:hypothetical protein
MNKFDASLNCPQGLTEILFAALDCRDFQAATSSGPDGFHPDNQLSVHFWTSLRKKLVYAPPPPK